MNRTLTLGKKTYTYSFWNGREIDRNILAFDTETTVVEDSSVPDLVLTTVSNGKDNYIVDNSQIDDFINKHKNKHWIGFNVPFDFWVLYKFTSNRELFGIVENNRMHDGMFLDALYRLAKDDTYPAPRNLGVVAKIYANMDIDKEDPYRMRYKEILGKDLNTVDEGFLSYAMKDTIATYVAYINLFKKAEDLALRAGVSRDSMKKYGLLTEAIQVKGAIALSKVTSTGMSIDIEYGDKLHAEFKSIINILLDEFISDDEYKDIFKRHKKTGDLLYTPTGSPSIAKKVLQQVFIREKEKLEKEYNITVNAPTTEKGQLSTSLAAWGDYIDRSVFLTKYDTFMENVKLSQFFSKYVEKTIHPRYNYFVRTGRTSQQAPNMQQWPKGPMRNMIIPSEGHLLVMIDYSFIELRTLAHVFEKLYKKSVLANVIKSGKDPHAWTGAMLNQLDFDDFMKMKKTKPDFFKKWRQNAKVVNFGLPGGLSAPSLLNYAKAVYGLHDWTIDLATDLRNKLLYEVYPELAKYLSEDPMMILAMNMDCSVDDLWEKFDWEGEKAWYIVSPIKNIVWGKGKKDGSSYNPNYVEKIWEGLEALNNNVMLIEPLRKREAGLDLFKLLFWDQVQTTTGRIRGRVSFSQCKNTPFQGLAADGAKLALWKCCSEGFRMVNFVHDEIVFEVKDRGGWVDKKEVDYLLEIMCGEMRKVTGDIPIEGEYLVARSWKKDGKMTTQGDKIFPE